MNCWFNEGVECKEGNCKACGFNPTVTEERLKKRYQKPKKKRGTKK